MQNRLLACSFVQATIMTDPGTADRTYIGPMTPEMVEEIIQLVRFSFHVGSLSACQSCEIAQGFWTWKSMSRQ